MSAQESRIPADDPKQEERMKMSFSFSVGQVVINEKNSIGDLEISIEGESSIEEVKAYAETLITVVNAAIDASRDEKAA
jgi:hypothetical protein